MIRRSTERPLALRLHSDRQEMIPHILHQTARSSDLSWEERRMVRRMRAMLPGWTYRFWDDDANGALVAAQFPRHLSRYKAIRFGVAKADIARYVYMHAIGGVYLDTDYKLLRPIGPDLLDSRCVIPLESAGAGSPASIPPLGNAALASEPGHPFWKELIEHIFVHNRPDELTDRDQIVGATGPHAVARFYAANSQRYRDVVLPPKNVFHPDIALFALKTSADDRTVGVHLHWGSWRGRSPAVAARILLRRKLNGLLS